MAEPYICHGSSLSRGPAVTQHRTTRTSEVTHPARPRRPDLLSTPPFGPLTLTAL